MGVVYICLYKFMYIKFQRGGGGGGGGCEEPPGYAPAPPSTFCPRHGRFQALLLLPSGKRGK